MVVTSPLTGDGKSTLVANLAVSLAEGGKRVLVVDCDFRRPAVGAVLDIDDGPGVREMTRVDERPLTDLASPTTAANVVMVRSGTRGVTPPWFMAQAADLVERATALADIVIFDTGPITLTNEAAALLPLVDTSLLVVRAGRTNPEQAQGAIEQFTQVSGHVSGIVLVGSESRRKYGYGYYRSEGSQRVGPVREQRQQDVEEETATGTWVSNGKKPEERTEPSSKGEGPRAGDDEVSDDVVSSSDVHQYGANDGEGRRSSDSDDAPPTGRGPTESDESKPEPAEAERR